MLLFFIVDIMSCIYETSSFDMNDYGKCTIWEEGYTSAGCDENGICICSDDPHPAGTCENYESDNICSECGVDLNVEECECDDDLWVLEDHDIYGEL